MAVARLRRRVEAHADDPALARHRGHATADFCFFLDDRNRARVNFRFLLFLAVWHRRPLVFLLLLKEGLQSSHSLLETAAMVVCALVAPGLFLFYWGLCAVVFIQLGMPPWGICALAVFVLLLQVAQDEAVRRLHNQ